MPGDERRWVSGSVSQARNEVDTKRHQNLASPFGGKATRIPTLSLGCRVQPRESESNSSYFAGRNATWSSKATPASGWNE